MPHPSQDHLDQTPASTTPASTTTDHRAVLGSLGYDAGPWPALLDDIDPDATHGRVVRADRGAATVATADGPRRVTWTPTQAPPVTGDWVAIDADDHLLGIAPRRAAISRPAHHRGFRTDDEGDQVLAANADLVGIVVPIDSDVRVRRLERGLVLAYESGAVPVVILTKADLVDDHTIALHEVDRAAVGVDVIVASTETGQGVEQLRALLAPDRTMALLGASGAGKSTLTNAVVGHHVLATGAVRSVDGKGRHTTTHRELVAVPSGGAILDTPGLRTLSVGQVGEGLELTFPEVEELTAGCRFRDCRHDGEPGCAVLAAIEDGTLAHDRFEGWTRIRAESENAALRADKARYRQAARRSGVVAREANRIRGGGPR
ncbi:ribosome small subunit-dependent GTPase A [soil metagenome]